MKYGSLFTGIGGFDLALDRAGMECTWQVEIDKSCQQVEARHWPNVMRYQDVKQCGKHNLATVDLICGGFPCQDLSVAGKRTGLAGERSGLWTEFHRIIAELGPRWVVIENVPGLLSSNKGRDFAVILRGLVECGYGVCWRVLDAQYFGVAQRRRRVFIVGHLGDGRAAEVLFEREGGAGDTPPSREAGEGTTDIAGTLASSGGGMNRPAGNANELDFCVPVSFSETGIGYWGDGISALRAQGERPSYPTRCIAWHGAQITSKGNHGGIYNDMSVTLNSDPRAMVGVRRLTPTECERLQGFPDGWTEGQSDSTRYRQLGNAVAVPVVEWIARRICNTASS